MSDNNKNNNGKKNNYSKKFNKKGIIITSVIVLGIISASFIVWFLPSDNLQNQNKDSFSITFSSSNDTLVYVNTHYTLLKDEIKNQLNLFKGQFANYSQLNESVDTTLNQNEQLMNILLDNKPPSGDMLNKYVTMMNTLKNFSFYLSDLKNISSHSTSKLPANMSHDMEIISKKWKMS